MNWYKKAQEVDEDIASSLQEFYDEERNVKIDQLRSMVSKSISKIVGKVGGTKESGWWREHVEPYISLVTCDNTDCLENPKDVERIIKHIYDATLIGSTTRSWHWMDQTMTEMDAELVGALSILIQKGYITSEVTFEAALGEFDNVMIEKNNKPGKASSIADSLKKLLDFNHNVSSEDDKGEYGEYLPIGTRVKKIMGIPMEGRVIIPFPWNQSTDGTYKEPTKEYVSILWDNGEKGWANKAWLKRT